MLPISFHSWNILFQTSLQDVPQSAVSYSMRAAKSFTSVFHFQKTQTYLNNLLSDRSFFTCLSCIWHILGTSRTRCKTFKIHFPNLEVAIYSILTANMCPLPASLYKWRGTTKSYSTYPLNLQKLSEKKTGLSSENLYNFFKWLTSGMWLIIQKYGW